MTRAILLLFLSATTASAQTARVELSYPPMPVNRVGIGLFLASREPYTGTITLNTGEILTIKHAGIPATFVRGPGFRKTVDACVGTGTIEGGGSIVVNLPPEPVRLRGPLFRKVMMALAIDCPTTVTLADGTVLTGSVHFGDCPTRKIGPGRYVADAITAMGFVKK